MFNRSILGGESESARSDADTNEFFIEYDENEPIDPENKIPFEEEEGHIDNFTDDEEVEPEVELDEDEFEEEEDEAGEEENDEGEDEE